MIQTIAISLCLFVGRFFGTQNEKSAAYPSYNYQVARTHEIKPLRHVIPLEGVQDATGSLLRLTLTVSDTGEVIKAVPNGRSEALKFWPQVQSEVYRWKFIPFEVKGKPVTAEATESISLFPPERFPQVHVAAPVLRPDSTAVIRLERSEGLISCTPYVITVSTDGIALYGIHREWVDPDQVRNLAKRFVAADFYSMDDSYKAGWTDGPTYLLSITIDGRKKEVADYLGVLVRMPAVITELENAVDELAQARRWIVGGCSPE